MALETELHALDSAAEQVSIFMIVGVFAALAIVTVRFFASNADAVEFEFFGAQFRIPLNRMWIVLVVLTVLHLYYATQLIVIVSGILDCKDAGLAMNAWTGLTGDASDRRLFFKMSERLPVDFGFIPLSVPFRSARFDPLMAMHTALALLIFFATLRWRRTHRPGKRFVRSYLVPRGSSLAIAIVLVGTNWIIGSQWALLASDLPRLARNEPQYARNIQAFAVYRLGAECSISAEHR